MTHVANVTLILDGQIDDRNRKLLLGLKRPKNQADEKRKRKKVGSGLFVPPGGGVKPSDKSQRHGAQREVFEETGFRFPLKDFKKVGTLRGYMDSYQKPLWLVHLYLVTTGRSDLRVSPNEEFV